MVSTKHKAGKTDGLSVGSEPTPEAFFNLGGWLPFFLLLSGAVKAFHPPSPLFCLAEILAFKSLGALIEIQSPESLGSENQGNHIFNKCPQWSLGKQKFENHCAKYIIQTLIHGFETCLPGYTTNS